MMLRQTVSVYQHTRTFSTRDTRVVVEHLRRASWLRPYRCVYIYIPISFFAWGGRLGPKYFFWLFGSCWFASPQFLFHFYSNWFVMDV